MVKIKPRSTLKVTFETGDRTITCATPNLSIGKDEWGRWENITIHSPRDITITPQKETPVIDDTPITEAPLSPEHEAAFKAVKRAARGIEHQQFANARAIERAIEDAKAAAAVRDHEFHMTVLEALHAGLTQEEIEKHLFDAGFNQLEEKVDSVRTLDTDLLYDGGL